MSKIGDFLKKGADTAGGEKMEKILGVANVVTGAIDTAKGIIGTVKGWFGKEDDAPMAQDGLTSVISTKISKEVQGKIEEAAEFLGNKNSVNTTTGTSRGGQQPTPTGTQRTGEATEVTDPNINNQGGKTFANYFERVKAFVMNNKIVVLVSSLIVGGAVAYFVYQSKTKKKVSSAKLAALAKARRARAAKAKSKPTTRRK